MIVTNRWGQRMFDGIEAFRMADHEMSPAMELPDELGDERLLGRTIEVNHDVTTEDDVEAVAKREGWRHEVKSGEGNGPSKLGCDLEHDPIVLLDLIEVSLSHDGGDGSDAVGIV